MNAADSATYRRICNTPFGDSGFHSVCDFIREANKVIPLVIASVVTVPGVDVETCRAVAESLGASFRIRALKEE
jgi:TatD DNase family protein